MSGLLKISTGADLLAGMKAAASVLGVTLLRQDAGELRGELNAIRAKWFLGGNKAVYTFSCRLDEPTHTATFREFVTDRSWGIPPPSFKVESYGQSGTSVTSTRSEKSVGGGGTLEFGKWRKACEQAVTQAGWLFKHDAMQVP